MTGDLAAFLAARLDEDEAAAKRALDTVAGWPQEVWVTPEADELIPSVGVSEPSPKRYLRLWNDAGRILTDHGWVVHDTAVCVWSEGVAARLLREAAAKRAVMAEHFSTDDLGAPIPAVCNRCTTDAIQIRFISPTECLPWPCPTVRALAAVYRNHPDYRQEWAPHG